jgi:hypothetical protein
MCCIFVVKVFVLIIFLASFLTTFLSHEIATSIDTCSFFMIMDCDVQFIVRDGSVSLHLFDSTMWLPNLHGLFVLILECAHTSVHCQILPPFPCIW